MMTYDCTIPMLTVIHYTEGLIQTVRIEGRFPSGKISVGTGLQYAFLVKKIDEKRRTGIRAVVTNRHVIEKKGVRIKDGYFYVNKTDESGKCSYGNKVMVEFKGEDWIHHPSDNIDLSVLPMNERISKLEEQGHKLFFVSDLYEIVPSNAQEWSRIGPLEDIVTIGYPNGLWDEQNNTPIARKGITATYANLNYRNKEQFVVDVPIFPGMSGSPVFAYSYGQESYESGGLGVGSKCLLIGILSAKLKYKVGKPGADLSLIPTSDNKSDMYELLSNLGVAIKSTKLKDFENIFKDMASKEGQQSD